MSAYNIGVTPDGTAAFINCDGIATDPHGVIVATDCPKAVWLGKARIVLCFRGDGRRLVKALVTVGTFSCFDAALAGMTDTLRSAFDIRSRCPSGHPLAMEIAIVGYSEARGRILAAVCSSDDDNPFALTFAPRILAPGLSREELQRVYWPSERQALANPDSIGEALRRAIEIQREKAVAGVLAGLNTEAVGGQAFELHLTKDGSAGEKPIFEWPDRVGEKLNCASGFEGYPRAVAA